MEAKELRIGNYVKWNEEFGLINQILEKEAVFKCGEMDLLDNINPVPLTKEWFTKANFEKIDHIHGYSFWSTKRNRKSKYSGITIYDNYTTIGNNSMVKHVEYVHQLQNLYFALTGEELEYNFE